MSPVPIPTRIARLKPPPPSGFEKEIREKLAETAAEVAKACEPEPGEPEDSETPEAPVRMRKRKKGEKNGLPTRGAVSSLRLKGAKIEGSEEPEGTKAGPRFVSHTISGAILVGLR
jgi:hypothetical protein